MCILESYLKYTYLERSQWWFIPCVRPVQPGGPVCPQQDHSAPSVGECPVCAPWECPQISLLVEMATGRGEPPPTSELHPTPPGGSSVPRKLTWDPLGLHTPRELHTL